MNKIEREMLDILRILKSDFGAVSVKAEFEAEGTRSDELLRLVDLARRADLNLALKIGGCEAVRDLIESKQYGAEYIIAPMVETPYALKKFIAAKNKIYSDEQKKDTTFLFNVETITAYQNLKEMLEVASSENGVEGCVFGRVDFAGSLDIGRSEIEGEVITDYAVNTARACKQHNMELVVGGGIAASSLGVLRQLHATHLSRFETRKIVFDASILSQESLDKGLDQTVLFELLWLKNKKEFYGEISKEDEPRILMLEKRWNEIKSSINK